MKHRQNQNIGNTMPDSQNKNSNIIINITMVHYALRVYGIYLLDLQQSSSSQFSLRPPDLGKPARGRSYIITIKVR